MSNNNHDEIILKIKKLLALANSPNEHEAKLASAKAQELLVTYNLNMQTIKRAETDYRVLSADNAPKLSREDKYVTQLLQKYFFVKVVYDRTCKTGVNVCFVGDKTNTETAMYMYNFLTMSFKRCFELYKLEYGKNEKSRTSYYFGFYRGLNVQLQEARQKVQSYRALVIVEDPNLPAAMSRLLGPVRSHTGYKSKPRDEHAIGQGKQDGSKLVLSKAVSGSSTNSGKLIG